MQFAEKQKQCLNSNMKTRKYLIVSQNYIIYGVIFVTKLCVNAWYHLQMRSAICKCVHHFANMYPGLKCTHICKCVIQTCRCEDGAVCGDKCGHLHRYRWLKGWSVLAVDAKLYRQIISCRSRGQRSHMTAWPTTDDFSVIFSFYNKTLWPFSHWYMCKCTNWSTHKAPSSHLWICFKHLQVDAHLTLEYVCKNCAHIYKVTTHLRILPHTHI